MDVKNIAPPLRLKRLSMLGVSAEAAPKDGQVKVWTRLAVTSDVPAFHSAMEDFRNLIAEAAREVGTEIDLARADNALVVLHKDGTADLWVDTVATTLRIMAKRNISAMTPVFEGDIADLTHLDFPDVDLQSSDRILFLFRIGWRFGLFFQLNPERTLDREDITRSIGTLYRTLRFRHLYELVGNGTAMRALATKGWFPFVEILGPEFTKLLSNHQAGFELSDVEDELVKAFDDDRVDRMLERWLRKPHMASKENLLRSAARSFKTGDPVPVIKIVLLEGVLSDMYYAAHGRYATRAEHLAFAVELAEKKAGGPGTLLFAREFLEYLQAYTYARFNWDDQATHAGSRHAVGHGAAAASSYTAARALQALLTLDQLAFYA